MKTGYKTATAKNASGVFASDPHSAPNCRGRCYLPRIALHVSFPLRSLRPLRLNSVDLGQSHQIRKNPGYRKNPKSVEITPSFTLFAPLAVKFAVKLGQAQSSPVKPGQARSSPVKAHQSKSFGIQPNPRKSKVVFGRSYPSKIRSAYLALISFSVSSVTGIFRAKSC